MIYLRSQFLFPRDGITTIGLREIAWDIHSGLEAVLVFRSRSQALGPPVVTVAIPQVFGETDISGDVKLLNLWDTIWISSGATSKD
jgi:hypothetical protein